MNKEYGTWSMSELKSELRKRNAKVTGRKTALIQRLKDYDDIFGGVVNSPSTTYIINTPNITEFFDINSDTVLPIINEDDIKHFTIITERDDIDIAKKMYEEYFLISARAANASGDTFVKGSCASQMRKNITYNIIIRFETHTILETQCECAAGMGPHAQCKHTLVVLYGLTDLSKNKHMKIRKTCTEQLQSFHRPSKYYTGCPIETENLKLKVSDRHLRDVSNFDPRPNTLKNMPNNKYIENLKNSIINFSAMSQTTFPVMQLIKPADTEQICHDHDYLEKNQDEMFLDGLKLNDAELKMLEYKTKINKKYWKKQRLLRLQSSDYAKICKSKEDSKTNLAKLLLKDRNIATAATKYGLKYEEQAVKAFTKMTGLQTIKCGIIVHETIQYLGCTPDRLIGDDAVLEIKCPYTATRKKISPETVPFLYLCDQSGILKLKETHDYYYQIQGQLLCTQRKTVYFCVYTLTDICVLIIHRNNNFIESMTEKIKKFYENIYKKLFLKRYLYKTKI